MQKLNISINTPHLLRHFNICSKCPMASFLWSISVCLTKRHMSTSLLSDPKPFIVEPTKNNPYFGNAVWKWTSWTWAFVWYVQHQRRCETIIGLLWCKHKGISKASSCSYRQSRSVDSTWTSTKRLLKVCPKLSQWTNRPVNESPRLNATWLKSDLGQYRIWETYDNWVTRIPCIFYS